MSFLPHKKITKFSHKFEHTKHAAYILINSVTTKRAVCGVHMHVRCTCAHAHMHMHMHMHMR